MKFFAHDDEDGTTFYETADEAEAHANGLLDSYRADAPEHGWYECVESICWGEITESAQAFDVEQKPDDLNDDNESESTGEYWPCSDFDWKCNYKMAKPGTGEKTP